MPLGRYQFSFEIGFLFRGWICHDGAIIYPLIVCADLKLHGRIRLGVNKGTNRVNIVFNMLIGHRGAQRPSVCSALSKIGFLITVQKCAHLDHPKANLLVGLGNEEVRKDTTFRAQHL